MTDEADPVVRSAMLRLLADQDAAWKAGDARAFCASALLSVVFTNVVGMFSVGLEPFEAQHEAIFSTIYKGSTLTQSLEHLSLVRPDVAIVDTLAELTGFSHLPPGTEAVGGVLRTRLEQVVVLTDGRWRVASFHNVSVNPAIKASEPQRTPSR